MRPPTGTARAAVGVAALSCIALVGTADARPYPLGTGLAAAADGAHTASSNPAGIARLTQRTIDVDLLWFGSESRWESGFTDAGGLSSTADSGSTVVPRFAIVEPIDDRWVASFTFLGTVFADDLGDWPGRYFIESYDSLFVSAFPSIAYRIDDRWSVAASAAVTYSRFEQERAVRNVFDPGFGDGRSRVEADSVELGFGVSMLYQPSARTRWGLAYNSEVNPSRSADNELSGLGPNTARVMAQLGILDADLSIDSTSPATLVAGVYHEFTGGAAITADVVWIDFSRFRLSEFYFDGRAFARSMPEYDDIYALSASYGRPAGERWTIAVGGFATNRMIDDDQRTMTLRLDAVWSLGVAAEWRWTESRSVRLSASYLGLGDAPVTTPAIPGLGSLQGRFTSRDAIVLQAGVSWRAPGRVAP